MKISIPMIFLILAYGPLNWSFPWWLWTIAIIDFGFATLFQGFIMGVKKKYCRHEWHNYEVNAGYKTFNGYSSDRTKKVKVCDKCMKEVDIKD